MVQSRILPALLPAECPERLRWNIHGPRRDKLKVRSNSPFVELRILPPVENRPGVERGIERPYGRHMKIARCRPGGKKVQRDGIGGTRIDGPGTHGEPDWRRSEFSAISLRVVQVCGRGAAEVGGLARTGHSVFSGVAPQTPIEKIQAGAADPQSSS